MSTMITREPTRNDMVQRRRARPRGLRGCAEPLGGLSRRLDAQRAFRSSNTKLSRVWLTLPPAAAALLALPVQKLNRSEADAKGPRCFGSQLHARQAACFWAEADKVDCSGPEFYRPRDLPRVSGPPRRVADQNRSDSSGEGTDASRINFRAVVGPGTPTPSRDASQAPGASKGREPARLAILRRSHYSQTRR